MSRRRRGASALAAAFAVSLGVAGGCARAETLADAIALAYQSNPSLQAQRAELRATDEAYVQAKGALGPTLEAQGIESYDSSNLAVPQNLPIGQIGSNTVTAQLSLTQPVYNGGRSTAAIRRAEAQIAAGRAQLRATEGNVVLAVIGAYSDVLRDQQSLAVRQQHLGMLAHQLDVTKARRQAGELTITDVAQAQAQLDAERSLVSDAQNQLQVSRAEYATVVGRNPGDLAPEPPLPGLPTSVDQAFDLAETDSPDLAAAERTEEASRQQVAAARAAYRPTLSLGGTAGYAWATQPYFGRSQDWNVTATATLTAPLFTNGQRASVVRQALAQNTVDRIGVENARRTMVQNLANAWNAMITARADVGLDEDETRAAAAAFKGMQIEYNAGERSTLDVLLAEQTLRNAQIALLAAQHDAYVASAQVLRYVGRLTAAALVPDLPTYDPAAHFRKVRNAGMVPWTGVVEAIDALAAPHPDVHPIPAPPGAVAPAVAPAATVVPADAPLATAFPTVPLPGTTSPQAPPRPSSAATAGGPILEPPPPPSPEQ